MSDRQTTPKMYSVIGMKSGKQSLSGDVMQSDLSKGELCQYYLTASKRRGRASVAWGRKESAVSIYSALGWAGTEG